MKPDPRLDLYDDPGEMFEAILALCGWAVWLIAVGAFVLLVVWP